MKISPAMPKINCLGCILCPSVCIYKYTQTHKAVFVFSLKCNHTMHIALLFVFHLLFPGPLPMPIHTNLQAYTLLLPSAGIPSST